MGQRSWGGIGTPRPTVLQLNGVAAETILLTVRAPITKESRHLK